MTALNLPPRRRLYLRAVAVFCIFILAFGVTGLNLARIQLIKGDEYREEAEKGQLYDSEIISERGQILDANGIVLAKSAAVWKIYINPSAIPNQSVRETVCMKLSEVLDVDYDSLLEKADSESKYLIVKKQVEYEKKEEIRALLAEKIDYINDSGSKKSVTYRTIVGIEDDVKRYYPYGKLASNLLGFTGADDVGRSGVELNYNSILTGTPGRIITAQNARSDIMSQQSKTVYNSTKGTNVVLTIDEVIQGYLEESLASAYKSTACAGCYGAIMEVKTGAILAMACMPNYDLNDTNALDQKTEESIAMLEDIEERTAARNSALYKLWRNFVVSDTYEPGSVFKTIVLSAALEEGVVTPETTYFCAGQIQVATELIHCHNHNGHGSQDLRKGLENSCNPFFITIGQKLGKQKFFEYFEAFGFTEKTGIDLPAEVIPVAGVNYHTLESMGIVELSSSSFGQSFQVTPIQMLTAVACIGNKGKLMTPYVVARQTDENGKVISETKPVVRRQVISEDTAATVSSMMESVVSNGSGKNAYVSGYHVAGKTGTSQKLSKKGYYLASFGCFAPADDAQVAMIIVIDEPKGANGGGAIAAPVASVVMEKTMEYLGIDRDYTDEEQKGLDKTMPSVINQEKNSARDYLRSLGYTVQVIGDGDTVVSQIPDYNQLIPEGGVVALYTSQDAEKLTSFVPDFTGMTYAGAKRLATAEGINVKLSGNANLKNELLCYNQSVSPGEQVEYGRTVTLYFKSFTNISDLG